MIDKQRLGTFVLGGAVGVLAGIFIAPRSGRELRDSIADRAGEARDRGRESYFENQERLQERLAEMGEGSRRMDSSREIPIGPSEEPDQEPTFDSSPAEPRLRGLRDVSRETPEELSVQPQPQDEERPVGDRSEELRRKVQETRDRLRRTKNPGGQA